MSEDPDLQSSPDRWRASDQAAGERLDAYLASVYDTARNQTARWIREGRVVVGNRAVKPSLRLEGGEWISCTPVPIRQEGVVEPESGEIAVLFEDEHLVVLDKPPHLVVHPGAGRRTGTLAHLLLGRYPEIAAVGGQGRPGIVHRLDKGTSGIMVVARTPRAYRRLGEMFADRHVSKRYLAIVFGHPKPAAGRIEAAIARHPHRRKEMTVSPRGRPALSLYSTLATTDETALLEVDLKTGRTHQIRVHLKHIGHPILGDPVYGEARWRGLPRKRQEAYRDLDRPALHAWSLGFTHPVTGARVDLQAPPAQDFAALWLRLSGSELSLEERAPTDG